MLEKGDGKKGDWEQIKATARVVCHEQQSVDWIFDEMIVIYWYVCFDWKDYSYVPPWHEHYDPIHLFLLQMDPRMRMDWEGRS